MSAVTTAIPFVCSGDKFPEGGEFEVHCFEPNPQFADCYADLGVHYHPVAAWIENATRDFYLGGADMVGSSLLTTKVSRKRLDYENPIKVVCIDFAEWLSANIPPESYVVLKLDIEGAEYDVVPHLINFRGNQACQLVVC
jgi:FkbM family methyltransferase